jgi:hypothetical protein
MKGEKQSKGRTTNREEKIYLTWGGGGVSIQTILYNVCMIMVDDDDTL